MTALVEVGIVAGFNDCRNRDQNGERDKERGGEFPCVECEHGGG
jgi:hypothetical protein